MGLLPYHSSAADGGQSLVIWTDDHPEWCGHTDRHGQPDCPSWEACDIASDVASIPAERNRCYYPDGYHRVEMTARPGSARDSSAPGTLSQWNWPSPSEVCDSDDAAYDKDFCFRDHQNGRNIRLDDHEMVFANIRVHPDNTYLQPAMREAFTDPQARDWISPSNPSFSCGQPGSSYPSGRWLCFSMAMAGEGVDEFEWIATRRIRLGIQYRFPD